jgi:hypothetical protein
VNVTYAPELTNFSGTHNPLDLKFVCGKDNAKRANVLKKDKRVKGGRERERGVILSLVFNAR